jgi:hypothetical protein
MCFDWVVGGGEVGVADVRRWIGMLFPRVYCRSSLTSIRNIPLARPIDLVCLLLVIRLCRKT